MSSTEKGIYIIGAGFAGQMIAQELKRKKVFGNVIAFLDDNKDIIGTSIDEIPVLGPIKNLEQVLRHSENDQAIIAIPSAKNERIKEIYETLSNANFKEIKIVPSVSQVLNDDVHLIQTRQINPLDILGRTPVTIPLRKSLSYLRGKRVLITGAGGSIGSELARQLLSGGAERLYLFGHGENSIYQIDKELRILQKEGVGEKAIIVPIIGELKDKAYIDFIIEKLKCDAVFHCAAYKHVPMMEENPVAAIENNVFGTKNLLDACLKNNVQRFVLISTDKAVKPVSVYGVSKMLSEKLVIEAALKASKQNSSASYMFVRFGNVIGSRGSILPLFSEQLKTGGPLTVTDANVKRFFMTIPEACSLVLQTGGVGKNGMSYLLDMGEPIKILDLAEQIIRISGFEPYKDIDIKFIGLRKGERIEEPLWTKEEDPQPTQYNKILMLKNDKNANFNLEGLLQKLEKICFFDKENANLYRNKQELLKILCENVPSLKEFYENNN